MDLESFVAEHGQTGAAEIIGVSQGAVWQWINGKQRITAERAIEIEEKTGGAVTRSELRPDIFGPVASDPKPDARASA